MKDVEEFVDSSPFILDLQIQDQVKGEVSPNNNVYWVSRKQFYKPNSKILSRFW